MYRKGGIYMSDEPAVIQRIKELCSEKGISITNLCLTGIYFFNLCLMPLFCLSNCKFWLTFSIKTICLHLSQKILYKFFKITTILFIPQFLYFNIQNYNMLALRGYISKSYFSAKPIL